MVSGLLLVPSEAVGFFVSFMSWACEKYGLEGAALQRKGTVNLTIQTMICEGMSAKRRQEI